MIAGCVWNQTAVVAQLVDLVVMWFAFAVVVVHWSLRDTVRKAWFPIAAWVQAMGEKVVSVVDSLEKRALPVKLHFSKCLEALIPPNPEHVTQYMSSTTVTTPMISKRAKHLKVHRVWE